MGGGGLDDGRVGLPVTTSASTSARAAELRSTRLRIGAGLIMRPSG